MYMYFHPIPLLGISLTYVLAYAQIYNNIYRMLIVAVYKGKKLDTT